MKLTDLIVLLPCHSLEDFPTYHAGEEAEGLLAAWTALWHPSLVATALKTPAWRRADEPPTPEAGMLLVVPTVVYHELESDYTERAAAAGAVLIQGLHRRQEIIERALAAILPLPEGEGIVTTVSPELTSDFLAVGLAYLLTELLTRRMRYMSNLDETAFQDAVLAAATAATTGDEAHARDRLRRACEMLYEARAHFYPVDTYLVDLTLVASTTLGSSLRQELAGTEPINLLAASEVIDEMAQREPSSLAAVRERLEAKTLTVIGGEYREAELPLFPLEEILAELEAGHRAYEEHLGLRPEVFGRRRAGLTPALPQVLRGLGYKGALHFTLDDGRFPQADRSKALWEGTSATAIDAIGRAPLDASQPASVLSLVEKLGESMDYDFVSMLSFAHWPAMTSEYYDDLRRICKYAPVLGKFITLDEFFTSTDSAGAFSKFNPDEYRSPYLKQAVAGGTADPLSTHVRRRQAEQLHAAAATLTTLASLLAQQDNTPAQKEEYVLAAAQQSLAAALCSPKATAANGVLLVNPLSFTRRALVDVSSLGSLPAVGGPIVALDEDTAQTAIVDVPGFGFAWIGPGTVVVKKHAKPRKPIAREHMLVNELCEVTIHTETGGIRSIRDLTARGNRLSQQIAMRLGSPAPMPAGLWRDPDEGIRYSEMVAESIEITSNSTVAGEITSRGRLLHPEGRELAAFVQTTRLVAEWAAVEIEIELAPHEEPSADAWSSYYACRFAWPDDLEEIRRSVHGASFATELKRLEAPDYVEIIGGKTRTAILTGGLPYHLRVGPRMLDSLLVVRRETARRFRLGIALENPQPWQAAAEFTSPSPVVAGLCPTPSGTPSGWLFHLDVRHVMATHWATLVEDGRVNGFQVRLLEFGGHGGSVTLRTFRDVASAQRMTLAGERAEELPVEGDRIRIEISAHEWLQLEARWTQ
jgi:alpha-mannosidase